MPKDDAVSAGVVSGETELILFSAVLDRGDDTEAKEERWLGGKPSGKPRPISTDLKSRLTDDCLAHRLLADDHFLKKDNTACFVNFAFFVLGHHRIIQELERKILSDG